jgi:hypothetical protein
MTQPATLKLPPPWRVRVEVTAESDLGPPDTWPLTIIAVLDAQENVTRSRESPRVAHVSLETCQHIEGSWRCIRVIEFDDCACPAEVAS